MERKERTRWQPKKRAGRPATGRNAMIAIRWKPELLAAIEIYADREMLSRASALRQIVGKFLKKEGCLRHFDQPKERLGKLEKLAVKVKTRRKKAVEARDESSSRLLR